MKELQSEDPAALKHFLRMQLPQFEELLAKVTPIIEKRDTRMRESISIPERLAITLRFLASLLIDHYCGSQTNASTFATRRETKQHQNRKKKTPQQEPK
ncbi:hypothetical protein LSAT2_033151 [Lamellibrachia satsuma]|nr:hypothetical protein LSAT2_033151 [Lamellibrachia satsuma]